MDEIIKILPNFKKFNSYINDVKSGVSPIMLSGLTDSGKVHFAYSTYFYSEKPVCIITYNEVQAKKLVSDLSYFQTQIDYFPRREILAYDYLAESGDIKNKRISCLNRIHNKKAKIVVTTIEAVMQKIISENSLYKNIIKLNTGETLGLEEAKEQLISLGYERVEIVEASSQFSIRGGIIDIAISSTKGVRIELWGDEIDSIRYFDVLSQRSTETLEKIEIYPATEFVLEDTLENTLSKITDAGMEIDSSFEDIESIKEGNYLSKVDKYFSSFYENPSTIIDYIKDDYIIFIDEEAKVKARSENILKDNQNVITSLIEKKRIVPQALTNLDDFVKFSREYQKYSNYIFRKTRYRVWKCPKYACEKKRI
ncbi:MAG: hypothetical protein FWC79_04755 [Oscillospiraceae bacterium]|nr:hypothetical protein [Oscillospiraceae bacterium]